MPLDDSYLTYPKRRYGMDHDHYEWSMLSRRAKVRWPQGAKLALWVQVGLNYFPLNQRGEPFKVPGGMTMPYPDLRHYTLRDYGNRVGIYRFLKAFDRYGIKPSFAINTRLAERVPYLMARLRERGDELLCHGWHMDALHYGGQSKVDEAGQIERALDGLRRLSGQSIRGWVSPGRSESENTPALLRGFGVEYFCDWVNDDMPYAFHTEAGDLVAMPLSMELEDRFILEHNLHSEDSYVTQIQDACDFLLAEAAEQGGRLLALSIHPWILGQPHRIAKLEAVLEYITQRPGVWSASAGDILDCVRPQL